MNKKEFDWDHLTFVQKEIVKTMAEQYISQYKLRSDNRREIITFTILNDNQAGNVEIHTEQFDENGNSVYKNDFQETLPNARRFWGHAVDNGAIRIA